LLIKIINYIGGINVKRELCKDKNTLPRSDLIFLTNKFRYNPNDFNFIINISEDNSSNNKIMLCSDYEISCYNTSKFLFTTNSTVIAKLDKDLLHLYFKPQICVINEDDTISPIFQENSILRFGPFFNDYYIHYSSDDKGTNNPLIKEFSKIPSNTPIKSANDDFNKFINDVTIMTKDDDDKYREELENKSLQARIKLFDMLVPELTDLFFLFFWRMVYRIWKRI